MNVPRTVTDSSVPPTVSAVIPVHNGRLYLTDAIASVLNQSRPVIECIVIDDGSTDGTRDVVEQFGDRVTYIRQDQAGVSVARNHGAQLARGDLVAFLDHDDVWLPDKLARQVQTLTAEGAAMALCAVRVVNAQLEVIGTKRLRSGGDLPTGMLTFDDTEIVDCSSTGLVWRETLLEMGGFDPSLSMSADWDLLFRMLLERTIAYVDEPLALYRVHDSNMSRRIPVMERDMVHAFAKAFSHPNLPASARRTRELAYGRLYRMLAGSYRDAGQSTDAARMLVRGIRHHPALLTELVRRPGSIRRRRPT